MDAIKENWTTVKEAVRREYSLSDISYHTWVEPLEFHNVVNDVVSIIIPSDQAHALNYISSKYKSFFQVTITEMFDHPYDINFILIGTQSLCAFERLLQFPFLNLGFVPGK